MDQENSTSEAILLAAVQRNFRLKRYQEGSHAKRPSVPKEAALPQTPAVVPGCGVRDTGSSHCRRAARGLCQTRDLLPVGSAGPGTCCPWAVLDQGPAAHGLCRTGDPLPVGCAGPGTWCLWTLPDQGPAARGLCWTRDLVPVDSARPGTWCLWTLPDQGPGACGLCWTRDLVPVGSAGPWTHCLARACQLAPFAPDVAPAPLVPPAPPFPPARSAGAG